MSSILVNLPGAANGFHAAQMREIAGSGKKPSQRTVRGVEVAEARAAAAGEMMRRLLVITPMIGAENCAALLTRQLGVPVEVARSRRAGLSALRRQEFGMVLVDARVVEEDPQGADLLWQHAGLAVPMVIDFVVVGGSRLVREVRQALARREREHAMARTAAAAEMQSELKSTLTALLLQSQLALAEPQVSAGLAEKLRGVVALASGLKEQLRIAV